MVGERADETFVVDTDTGVEELPPCVMSFAYWNPEILLERQLLNAQTGKLMDVTVDVGEAETLTVRGHEVSVRRYRLRADDVQIDLWYANDDEWVALESLARGGRTLRYELT